MLRLVGHHRSRLWILLPLLLLSRTTYLTCLMSHNTSLIYRMSIRNDHFIGLLGALVLSGVIVLVAVSLSIITVAFVVVVGGVIGWFGFSRVTIGIELVLC